jgi:hypothetical protein
MIVNYSFLARKFYANIYCVLPSNHDQLAEQSSGNGYDENGFSHKRKLGDKVQKLPPLLSKLSLLINYILKSS